MSVERAGGESLSAQAEQAERRLKQLADVAAEAERRAEAEIKALEADLERERANTDKVREELRLVHEEELERERVGKDKAIAEAEKRLEEIEAQAEAAERRIEEATARAAAAEQAVEDERARARESAASWLRQQLDSIRREAEGR
ncbi:MAG: hypothetical protein ABW065_01895 [Solirubrobacterales bacterium]